MYNSPESTCPVCESWSTDLINQECEHDDLYFTYKCDDCESWWIDKYRYDSSKITVEEGKDV